MSDVDVDPWIDRINAQVKDAQGLRGVMGIADLGLIIGQDRVAAPVTPGVYVIPDSENAPKENDLATGATHQEVTERVSIVSAIQNVRDATGRVAHQNLRALRRALKDALIGWTPDVESAPVEFDNGKLFRFSDQTVLWMDTYRTRYHEYHT